MKPRQAGILALLIASFLISEALKAAPCPASATVMCLAGQRFAVEVRWKDFQGNTGQGQAVGLTPDTGYFWFFTDNNVELVVKVLDARGFNNHFWVFFGALSNVEYTLTVTDTATGRTKSYVNSSGQFASVGDTAAFPGAGVGVAATHETVAAEGTPAQPESLGAIQRFVDAASARSASEAPRTKAASSCPESDTSLYLSNCRFELEAHWTDPQGNVGSGHAVQLTGDTGYFWFFTDNNVELIVKLLDARAFNGSFWVFYGALSNVQYSLHVTDTVSGALHIYENPSGAFASVGDTSAFRGGYGIAASLDSARAVSGDITAAIGGTLSATAANGTVFTLEVPPNALISDKTITMTPVSAIERLPFAGGLVAGVSLEPSGLYLLGGARLTIRTPSPISQIEETSFAWNGSGEDFFFYPPVAAKGDLQMYIFHLGGYGVGRGTEAERQAQTGKEPVADDDRLSHQIAPLLRQSRAEAQSGSSVRVLGVTTPTDVREVVDNEYKRKGGLRDQMVRTLGYPDQVVDLVGQVQAWESAVERYLVSLEDAFPGRKAEIRRLFEGMLARALELIRLRCAADVTEIRLLPQILWSIQTLVPSLLGQASQVATKCLKFRLTFDSTITATGLVPRAPNAAVAHGAKAEVSLTADFPTEGSISVRYLSVNGIPPESGCVASYFYQGPSPFKAFLSLGHDLEKFSPARITVSYFPGNPASQISITCPSDDGQDVFILLNWWGGVYLILHSGDISGGFITASGWTATGGKDPWATRAYVRPMKLGPVNLIETTFLTLAHTPE